ITGTHKNTAVFPSRLFTAAGSPAKSAITTFVSTRALPFIRVDPFATRTNCLRHLLQIVGWDQSDELQQHCGTAGSDNRAVSAAVIAQIPIHRTLNTVCSSDLPPTSFANRRLGSVRRIAATLWDCWIR